MAYKKPVVLATNQPGGSYSAGCPTASGGCTVACEIRQ